MDSPIIRDKPWIIFGDFNEILDMDEHSRMEDHPAVTSGMRDFQSLVNYCSFSDLASHGPFLLGAIREIMTQFGKNWIELW